MEIILNASLAGGVIMGANAVAVDKPWGAMLAGVVAGSVSSLGFAVLQPFLRQKINFHDTCGVHNLHAIPGFLGGILSCILAYLGRTNFGNNYGTLWWDEPGLRTTSQQAGFQLAALFLSMGFGLFGGFITGLIVGWIPYFLPPQSDKLFDDKEHWFECEIDHETLHNLFVAKDNLLQEDDLSDSQIFHKKREHHNLELIRVDPKTINEDQDLDILNLHKDDVKQ